MKATFGASIDSAAINAACSTWFEDPNVRETKADSTIDLMTIYIDLALAYDSQKNLRMVRVHAKRRNDMRSITVACAVDEPLADITRKLSDAWNELIFTTITIESLEQINESNIKGSGELQQSGVIETVERVKKRLEESNCTMSASEIQDLWSDLSSCLESNLCNHLNESNPLENLKPTFENPILWWAGKPLKPSDSKTRLRDFMTINDKSCVSVLIMDANDPPPPRETRMDVATYNNMLNYLTTRQETLRTLDRDDDDSYLMSEWTNPKGLKNHLIGNQGKINWKF